MSTFVSIPGDLQARYSRTPQGRAWLSGLPGLIDASLERWQLSVDLEPGAEPWNGHGGIVIPVRYNGTPSVLKIAFPHEEALVERHALALWGGSGAVRLLEADAASCAMLLERLDALSWLQAAPMDEARDVWGSLMKELGIEPDDRPEWKGFEHIAARAERWSDELPAEWEHLGQPFPRWLLEAALEVCQTRGAVGRRAGKDVLVHCDLHFMNILPRLNGGSTLDGTGATGNRGYVAIDPQPMIGEAEFAVAPILWNRIRDLSRTAPEVALLERCADFSSAAGLDGEAAREWSLVREVDNALWYAGKPRHEGDLARSLWVASTLAGRPLDGLPAAHDLPEPGLAGSN
ncbi:aminoglycoside phosphotransferase family protein [Arthrobacter bambusae]|uniref:aminoglycoside phosphotransferase family protein n=1 Tax=Arthrobacter bambusae TaxID=1338426 RepID=UPI00278342A7|nr:aminoglycoside phosphotransferase family protein [Arthrobacter bambusae]MDQ0028994.1 streptomycin 6-kinase [Arthrobacter bambusae]MDQ0098604.1 streptomycin 6-kinase [Arthrobacter bambusae]